jgi:hypothetical protein
MKTILLAVPCLVALSGAANAMQGFSTCHAAGTTVTSIEGLGTSRAKMLSVETLPDALESCHRMLVGSALMACALKEMQEGYKNLTMADCRRGTLSNEFVWRSSHKTENFKFPMSERDCASDADAARNAFRSLCPDHEGKLGDEPQ